MTNKDQKPGMKSETHPFKLMNQYKLIISTTIEKTKRTGWFNLSRTSFA